MMSLSLTPEKLLERAKHAPLSQGINILGESKNVNALSQGGSAANAGKL